MARRTTDERVQISVKLPSDLLEELQRIADERDVSVSLLISKAIRTFLNHLPPLPGEPEPAPAKAAK